MSLHALNTNMALQGHRSLEPSLLPLEERLRRELAHVPEGEDPPADENDPPADDNLVGFLPIISVEMEAAVKHWACQQFVEKMMFGEKEETGITPLSIDL